MMPLQLLLLESYPIYDQLLLEERLLCLSGQNWCIINQGSPRAIVMGVSGKKEELIDCCKAEREGIPLIKRFSGGGTVIVDEDTLFVTFISQKRSHDFPAYPEPIMKWTEGIYKEVFQHPDFALRDNDYVWKERKIGGNAQYIKRDGWLHHTSFLWNYNTENMEYLLYPKKTPAYRQGRSHEEFLCRIGEFFPEKTVWVERLVSELKKRFCVKIASLNEALEAHQGVVRQSTVRWFNYLEGQPIL